MKLIISFVFLCFFFLIYKIKRRKRENNLELIHSNSLLAKFFQLITDHFLQEYVDGLSYPGHAQTFLLELIEYMIKIYRNNHRFFKFKLDFKEEFVFKDGGSIAIDHVKCTDKNSLLSRQTKEKILVIIPGFTSYSDEFYIRNFMDDFVEEFDCRVMNVRGFGMKLTSPYMVSTHCYKDIREYIEYICDLEPHKNVFAVGFSFGGMLLARCLGTDPNTLPKNFMGGCGICYPHCLIATKKHVDKQLGGFYSKYAARNIRKCFFENIEVIFDSDNHPHPNLIEEKESICHGVKNLINAPDFDCIYTYKILKFKCYEDYLDDAKLDKYLIDIKVPFLSIFSKDDPIIPHKDIPFNLMKKNEHLITIVSNKGGHLGFFTGVIPQRWINIPIKTFFKTVEIIHDVSKEVLEFNHVEYRKIN